jgi:hypothetical protein
VLQWDGLAAVVTQHTSNYTMALLTAALLVSAAAAAAPSLGALPPALPAPLRAAAAQLERALLAARAPAHWARLGNSTDSKYCPDAGAFDWVPLTVANLSAAAPAAVFPGSGCFGSLSASASFSGAGVEVTLTGASPATLLCSDVYTITTSFSIQLPVEVSALAPTQKIAFPKWAGADEAADVALNGIHVALLPCGIVGSLASILATVNLFVPLSLNASDMIPINSRFLNERGVWSGPGGRGSPLVPFGTVQDLDPSLIKSGDYLTILRFDGLDPLIAFGTGLGATGHSAVCMWKGAGASRSLYVIESTDGPAIFGPPAFFGHGIIQTPWADWVALARVSGYNVAVLPLAPQYAATFDEAAVWSWFEGIEGSPYGARRRRATIRPLPQRPLTPLSFPPFSYPLPPTGYQNLLFSVLDTADPFVSLPLPIDEGVVIPFLNLADQLLGPAPPANYSTSLTVDTLFVHALNKRMGTACATFACVIAAANANKAAGGGGPTSVLQAAAVPESDEWRYAGGVVFVCSGFAAAAYKVGLPHLAPFNATEQTPTDNVKWALWDGGFWNAGNCPVGLWRPSSSNGTVCQIMGPVRMPLDGFNTIPHYARINEHCGSQWPDYARCVGQGAGGGSGGSSCEC